MADKDLQRWKFIAREACLLLERSGLALDNIEQHDPELVEHALKWADKEMAKRYRTKEAEKQ